MEEKRDHKKIKNGNSIIAAVIFGAIVLFVGLLSVVLSQKETNITEKDYEPTVNALYCEASEPTDPFFESASVINDSHEIKVIFRNGGAFKLSYNYYGVYNTEGAADAAHTRLHADYNIYMGSNETDQESLYPTFDFDGSKVKVNLFAEVGSSLNLVTARLFFLSVDEFESLAEYSEEDLKNVYEDKGFSCTFKE